MLQVNKAYLSQNLSEVVDKVLSEGSTFGKVFCVLKTAQKKDKKKRLVCFYCMISDSVELVLSVLEVKFLETVRNIKKKSIC